MGQGENLFLNTADPSAGSWAALSATLTTPGSFVSPANGFTSFDVVEDNTFNQHGMRQAPGLGGADPYALDDKARFSVAIAARAGVRDWLFFLTNSGTLACFFDVANGLVGTETGMKGTIDSLGDGWFLCSAWYDFGNRLDYANFVTISATTTNGIFSYAGTNGAIAQTWAAPHCVKANYPEPLTATTVDRKVGPIENSLKGPQV